MIDNARNEVRNEEGCGAINPVCSGVACSWSYSRSATAEESSAHRILNWGLPSAISARIEAFRQGLRELGYVEGKNIVIEWRSSEGKADRFPALAAELVRLKVDVIVTTGPPTTRAAKQATVTIPIVMGHDDDPVGSGSSQALLGLAETLLDCATLAPEIAGKQLELLREIVPKLSRVAVIGTATRPGNPQALREIDLAADAVGVQLQYLEIQIPKDIETAFRAASKERADAVLVLSDPSSYSSAKTDCRPRGKEPAPGDIQQARICGRRGPCVLRRKLYRLVPSRRHVCGQDPQRRQARRSSGRTTDQV